MARRGGSAWLGVFVLATLVAGRSGAADPRDEARTKLREGVALMARADYAGALAAFEAAYALLPNPKLQFNIGTAQDALARRAAAHEAFTRFLADPRDAPPETIAKAREEVARLDTKVGRLAVTSDRADDQVFVDGHPRGATPLPRPLVVDAGAHVVVVTRGTAQFAENVSLGEGETRTLGARFAPPVEKVIAREDLAARDVAKPVRSDETTAVKEAPPPAPPPFYARTWFWLVVGGVAAAGIAGAVLLRPTDYPPTDGTVTVPMPP